MAPYCAIRRDYLSDTPLLVKVTRGRREGDGTEKIHDRASLSRPLVLFLGPLTSLTSFPLFCTSEDINGRGWGGPLTKWGWRGRGPIVMTFSGVFFSVPFLASPVDLHGQLGAIPPPPFLSVSPLESMRSGGAQNGISATPARYPMKTRQMVAIPPSAILPRKGIARYGGVSRIGPLSPKSLCKKKLVCIFRSLKVLQSTSFSGTIHCGLQLQ